MTVANDAPPDDLSMFAQQWIRALKARNTADLLSMFADEGTIRFDSPVVHTQYTDRQKIFAILTHMPNVLREMEYTEVYRAGT